MDEQVRPSGKWVKLTKGTAFAAGVRALCCGTPGTVNMTDSTGTAVTNYPLQQGYNPIKPQSLQAGGTADDIWALY